MINKHCTWVILSLLFAGTALANEPAFTPTSQYHRLEMQGWTVLVNPELDNHPKLRDDTLELLGDHLYRITRKIHQPALNHLREQKVWVEYEMPKTACMCYHLSRDWLGPNGYNPEKEGSIEVGNAKAFLKWTQDQPWMVLHELAHGYHHQVLGYGHVGVRSAWEAKAKQGDYDEVFDINGRTRKHYALTNDTEYFAETTESFFGTNDFHPFVRGELMRVDPKGAKLMKETWFGKQIKNE